MINILLGVLTRSRKIVVIIKTLSVNSICKKKTRFRDFFILHYVLKYDAQDDQLIELHGVYSLCSCQLNLYHLGGYLCVNFNLSNKQSKLNLEMWRVGLILAEMTIFSISFTMNEKKSASLEKQYLKYKPLSWSQLFSCLSPSYSSWSYSSSVSWGFSKSTDADDNYNMKSNDVNEIWSRFCDISFISFGLLTTTFLWVFIMISFANIIIINKILLKALEKKFAICV